METFFYHGQTQEVKSGQGNYFPAFWDAFGLGESLFTSFRTFQGQFLFFDHHFERLWDGLFFCYPECHWIKEELRGQLLEGLFTLQKKFPMNRELYFRITFYPAPILPSLALPREHWHFMVSARVLSTAPRSKEEKKEEDPLWGKFPLPSLTLGLSSFRVLENPSWSASVKTGNYLNKIWELKKVKEKGVDDLIYLDHQGLVTEATTSNLFVIKEGIISTPPLSSVVLNGVFRRNLLAFFEEENFSFRVGPVPATDLACADEVFLSNSVKGPMSVKNFLNEASGGEKEFENSLTQIILKKFESFCVNFLEKERKL